MEITFVAKTSCFMNIRSVFSLVGDKLLSTVLGGNAESCLEATTENDKEQGMGLPIKTETKRGLPFYF